MIQFNTTNISDSLNSGGLRVGDLSSCEVVLLFASCRGIPHLNYLNRYNDDHGKPFFICFIDPYVFAMHNKKAEDDENVKDIIGRATIFIHEHYENYGMFNTSSDCNENAYMLGLSPRLDISIPNFNNISILINDQIMFGGEFSERVRMCGNPLSHELIGELRDRGESSLARWRKSCEKTSFPEFSDYFDENWKKVRMFTSSNHISNHYTVPLFSMMCKKFLGINIEAEYERMLHGYDLFSDKNGTPVTQYDRDAFGIKWNEPTVELKI